MLTIRKLNSGRGTSDRMNEPAPTAIEQSTTRLQRVRAFIQRIMPFALGVLATLIALLLYNVLVPPPKPLTENDVKQTIAQVMASATAPPAYSSLIYPIIRPSMVIIESRPLEGNGLAAGEVGSGVIINDSGDILTSLHVVSNVPNLHVTFADGTESSASIIGVQAENDIAVLSAEQLPAQFLPATLGNPDAMRVGDEVFVVGNPYSLYSSMSAGVISGFDRTFRILGTGQELTNLIQFDAAVNPGNSGGPLVNRAGQVIGIVTALLNPTEDDVFIGIGFAVRIDTAGGAAGSPPI